MSSTPIRDIADKTAKKVFTKAFGREPTSDDALVLTEIAIEIYLSFGSIYERVLFGNKK